MATVKPSLGFSCLAGHAPLLLAALAGCAHGPTAFPPSAEEGEASYYDAALAGHATASGARLDLRAFTCAHRTLPFGTRLRVTALDTGRSTEVEVTDRGPFVRGRVLDVTPAAAAALGFLTRGVTRVRLEVLRVPALRVPP